MVINISIHKIWRGFVNKLFITKMFSAKKNADILSICKSVQIRKDKK